MQSARFKGRQRTSYTGICRVDEIIYMCVLPAVPEHDAFGFPSYWRQKSYSKCKRDVGSCYC